MTITHEEFWSWIREVRAKDAMRRGIPVIPKTVLPKSEKVVLPVKKKETHEMDAMPEQPQTITAADAVEDVRRARKDSEQMRRWRAYKNGIEGEKR